MPDPITGVIAGGSILGASSANKAAKAQTNAANRQIDVQERIYNQTRDDLQPWVQSGATANQAANYLLGLGAAPVIGGTAPQVETFTETTPGSTVWAPGGDDNPWPQPQTAQPTTTTRYRVGGNVFGTLDEANAWAQANQTGGTPYSWEGSPGYQFQLDQGLGAVQGSAAARGSLNSGRTMQALQEYGTGLANQDFYNYLNVLMGQSAGGQNAAAQQAQAGQNYATGTGNALAGIGNAQAAGSIGVNNALQGGINNLIGYQKYNSGLSNLYNSPNGGGQVGPLSSYF